MVDVSELPLYRLPVVDGFDQMSVATLSRASSEMQYWCHGEHSMTLRKMMTETTAVTSARAIYDKFSEFGKLHNKILGFCMVLLCVWHLCRDKDCNVSATVCHFQKKYSGLY